jgi:hypothetical protein
VVGAAGNFYFGVRSILKAVVATIRPPKAAKNARIYIANVQQNRVFLTRRETSRAIAGNGRPPATKNDKRHAVLELNDRAAGAVAIEK